MLGISLVFVVLAFVTSVVIFQVMRSWLIRDYLTFAFSILMGTGYAFLLLSQVWVEAAQRDFKRGSALAALLLLLLVLQAGATLPLFGVTRPGGN
jgi:hypothetical protein